MEKMEVTSKVINARLEQVDCECMAETNAAVEGRKRVRLVFSALSESADITENSFLSFCAKHTSNALYSVILNLDNVKNAKGVLLSDDEATALIWSEAEKANNVLPLTVVNVPISCALDGVDALYTAGYPRECSHSCVCWHSRPNSHSVGECTLALAKRHRKRRSF